MKTHTLLAALLAVVTLATCASGPKAAVARAIPVDPAPKRVESKKVVKASRPKDNELQPSQTWSKAPAYTGEAEITEWYPNSSFFCPTCNEFHESSYGRAERVVIDYLGRTTTDHQPFAVVSSDGFDPAPGQKVYLRPNPFPYPSTEPHKAESVEIYGTGEDMRIELRHYHLKWRAVPIVAIPDLTKFNFPSTSVK